MSIFGFTRSFEERDTVLPMFTAMFVDIQQAVNDNDESILRDNCTQEMFDFFRNCNADNNRNGVINVIQGIKVQNIYTVDNWYDEDLDQEFQSVNIQFWMADYYTDFNGNVLPGSNTELQYLEEVWVFTRNDDSNEWFLASIED